MAVRRRRLTDRLQQGLYRRLTLIAAPAGYGKTALVSEWLAGCGRPAAWLALEPGDGELARFLTGTISALQTLAESVGESVLSVLQSPVPAPAESLLTALLNEIAALPDPFLLVLDDYHAASSPAVDAAVSFLLDHLPEQMHLVMTTREMPDLPLARLRARDQLTELRMADMRFTLDEAESLFNRTMGLALSRERVADLQSRTEGWAAGLQLAAVSIQEDPDADRLLQAYSGNHRFVLDYLAEEVLQRQPESIQAFLLRTSILDRLCGPLCDRLMPGAGMSGKAALAELDRKNLFVVPLDQERRWYRYHHLFADILRRRLEDSLNGEQIAELHGRASEWQEANGFEIEAFRHAVQSGNIERSSRLLQGGGMPLHLQGAAGIALDWLASLPDSELDARPALWVIYGSALLMSGKPTEVEAKLQAAEAAMAGAGRDADAGGLAGWIAATRATLASLAMAAEQEGTDRHLRAVEAAMQDAEPDDKTDELVGLIAPASRGGSTEMPGVDRVIAQSRLALANLRPDNVPVRAAAAWMLGVACQRQGDYAAACEAYREVLANRHRIGHRLLAVMAMIGIGQIREAERRPDLAAERYREALSWAGDLPHPAIQEARTGLERAERALAAGRKGDPVEPLSEREVEVLKLIAQGLSNREIGEKLFLALDTVKGHNRRIFEKLQVSRRTEAVARARELNVIP